MLAAPNPDLSVSAQNKDRQHTPVSVAVGKKVAYVKNRFFTSVSGKEILCRHK